MIAIVCRDVEIYSMPLSKSHKIGYDEIAPRVCRIKNKSGEWTGFLCKDTVLTTGWLTHLREVDIIWYDGTKATGFMKVDSGNICEYNVSNFPKVDPLGGRDVPPDKGEILFIIGNFFGLPFSMVDCTVSLIGEITSVLEEGHLEMCDTFSTGSPVFNVNGILVGVLEFYVESTDNLVVRSLLVNKQGLLSG